MEKTQVISFANKMAETLNADSRSVTSKLEKATSYNLFKCKIKGNSSVSFDLSLLDISGTAEYHVFKRTEPNLVSQTYKLVVKNTGTEQSISVTNQDKSNADVFDALKLLFNAIKQASEKNLNSNLDAIIKG